MPDQGLSEDEEFELLSLERERAMANQQPQQPTTPDMSGSFPEIRNLAASNLPIRQKLWESLNIPSQMSQRGLNSIAQSVPQPEPTGNTPLDVIKGTPRIAAETLAEAAPKFINRSSIILGGLAKLANGALPLAKAVRQGVLSQGEQISGAAPGSLNAAYEDPTLIAAAGKKAAGPLYVAAKAEMPEGASIFKGMYKPEQIVDTAQEYLSKGGKLEPAEALTYRKAIDSLSKSGRYVKDELFAMRQEADAMAKGSENIAKADPLYQRGRYAESLRNLMPQNKYGGASAFKMGIMAALNKMGAPGKAAMVALSPAGMGVAATGAGILSRLATPVLSSPGAVTGLNILGRDPQIRQELMNLLQRMRGNANASQ